MAAYMTRVALLIAFLGAAACRTYHPALAAGPSGALVIQLSPSHPQGFAYPYLMLIGPSSTDDAALCIASGRDSVLVADNLVPGDYHVRARGLGYYFADSLTRVRPGAVDTVALQLRPTRPCDLDCGEVVLLKEESKQPKCLRTA